MLIFLVSTLQFIRKIIVYGNGVNEDRYINTRVIIY
ncbi:hypothetical protein Xmir_01620 [Xenorhabdus miraniensis]|uniref:Uncharacterized protein n=1 Tax=Xenorhabdus miraniensis TaxID=351674 RepID=A0A2D0JSJ0_9GAMM|nr:hypothetical protein Xmir_01620 [Xenorhabdus miraniensis]